MKKIRVLMAAIGFTLAMSSSLAISDIAKVYDGYYLSAANNNGTGKVTGDGVNVRSGPSKDSDKIGTINGGSDVTIIGKDGSWYEIEFEDGSGYISEKYVDYTEPEEEIEEEEANPADEAINEEPADEEEEEEIKKRFSLFDIDVKTLAIFGTILVLMVIIITATIVSLKRLDDDDDDYDYDDYDDDYDDYDDDYDDEDEYDDEYEDDYYEDDYDAYDDRNVRKKKSSQTRVNKPVKKTSQDRPVNRPVNRPENRPVNRPENRPVAKRELFDEDRAVKYGEGADPVRYMSNNPDDYRINIDPKFFETTTLPIIDDEDAPRPISDADKAKLSKESESRDEDIAEAMKKMEELKREIERLKSES